MKIIKVKSQAFDVIVRWIHLVALAVGVGGVGFVVLVLFPSWMEFTPVHSHDIFQ